MHGKGLKLMNTAKKTTFDDKLLVMMMMMMMMIMMFHWLNIFRAGDTPQLPIIR